MSAPKGGMLAVFVLVAAFAVCVLYWMRKVDKPLAGEGDLRGARAEIGWSKLVSNADARVRTEAIREIGKKGAAAAGITPAVRSAIEDPDPAVRLEAVIALWRIDRELDGAIVTIYGALSQRKLGSAYPWNREGAFGLGRSCDEFMTEMLFSREAARSIIRATQSKDVLVRRAAVWFLNVENPVELEPVVDALIGALGDEDPMVKWLALERMSALGSKGRRAVPMLRAVAGRLDHGARVRCAMHLFGAQAGSPLSLPVIVEMLNIEESLYEAAITALRKVDVEESACD